MILDREASSTSSRASRLLDRCRTFAEDMPRQMVRICPERSCVDKIRSALSKRTILFTILSLVSSSSSSTGGIVPKSSGTVSTITICVFIPRITIIIIILYWCWKRELFFLYLVFLHPHLSQVFMLALHDCDDSETSL